MGNALGRVMIVGKDRAAMDAWSAVLDHFWPIHIRAIEEPMGKYEIWPQEELTNDLAILCSSIPPSEQQEWIDSIRHQAPHILLVRMNGFDSGPHANADATVDEVHGPGALVSTIYELLTERGLGSRTWPIAGDPPRLH